MEKKDFMAFYFESLELLKKNILKHGANWNDVEDVCQDVYLIALERWGELQDHPNQIAWAFKTARNIWMAKTKKEALKETVSLSLGELSEPLYEEEGYAYLVMESTLVSIYNTKEYELLLQFAFHGYSIEELSLERKIPEGTLRMRICRIRKKLKWYLENTGGMC